ncbi:MAG TPA: MFS transporter [Gemmataceae bacterium]|nr:MFS transporter [Gemmataceae bacterium]
MNQSIQVAQPSAKPPAQHEPIASWRWGIVWLLFLATTLNYMDRQTLQSTATYIIKDLQLDEEGYGWIAFAFNVSYGLFQFPAGFLADRWNLRRLYVAALLVWSAAGFMIGMSDTVLMMSACRFILGLGEAFNWPCAATAVRRVIPHEARGLANGIFHSGASMGAIITPFLVLAIVVKAGLNWRVVFQVVGALGLVWAALWYWCLRGPRASVVTHPTTSEGDIDLHRPTFAEEFRSFTTLMNLRIFWITFVVSLTINFCWHFYRDWLPRFLDRDLRFDSEEIQWSLMAYFLGADLGSLSAGYMTRKLTHWGFSLERSRKIVLMAAALLCVLSTPAVLANDAWVTMTLIVLVGAGSLGCFPIWLTMTQELSGRHTAVCIGFFGTTGWIAIAASSPLIGKLVDQIGTFGPCLIVVGFVPLIGAVGALWWPEPQTH